MADGSKTVKAEASLYAAFCAAQSDFGEIVKTTKGARGKYAPLDAVLSAIVPALNRNGLVLCQPTRIVNGAIMVETRIIHAATGEFISCDYPVADIGKPHQETGAALSYAKRYSVLSLCGVAPENEDDDDKLNHSNSTGRQAPKIEQKVTPVAEQKREMTVEERVKNFRIKLSQQKDADEVIVLWESPRAEELRALLNEDQHKELASYYGQVLSRFEGAMA